MNGFQKKPLYSKWEKKASHWIKGHIILTVIILILGAFTIKGVVGAIKIGEPFSVKQIVISAISNGIETDSYGRTNILLLGIGGEGHDGANLTDTMIVASIDYKNNLLPMLSIPRDLYVENEKVGWGTRLNGIYELILDDTGDQEQAIEELRSEIEKILGIEIQYYAMVDFQGFEDIVDAIGGISIDVESELYDPFYPGPDGSGITYDPFYVSAGTQEMDGETALKYARSRSTSSDFDRARRQQKVINAIKEKALNLGFVLKPGKITDTIKAISNNFKTNLSIKEIITLAGMADKFNSDSMISEVINDLAYERAGFLYTPEREAYGGAFVLVPYAGSFDEINMFAKLFFYNPEVYKKQTPIQILNGTKTESLAGLSKMYLHRYGFNVIEYGNAIEKNVEKTKIYILDKESSEEDKTAEILPSLTFGEISYEVPEKYQSPNWETEASIIIELGEDFAKYYKENKDLFYIGFY